jgi:hypothetical protein
MLAFLHTSRVHVDTFSRLAREVDEKIPVRHEVREDLLCDAIAAGTITDALRSAIGETLRHLASEGAKVIVCTCSTIAGEAEVVRVSNCSVMRIDRPMAEEAVASGRRIVVVAALRSTFVPTVTLLRQVAASVNQAPLIVEVLCEGAWSRFEAADLSGYAAEIARTIEQAARPGDVILLAQTSMAPAVELVRHLGIPVLSSPRSGVEAAVSMYRTATPSRQPQ